MSDAAVEDLLKLRKIIERRDTEIITLRDEYSRAMSTIATITDEVNELDMALTETMRERDALQAATRRVVEAAQSLFETRHIAIYSAEVRKALRDALADPTIVALRRDADPQDEDEEDQGHERICRALRRE
jgi:uncharacterized coiled-coil DUF342 family protein